MRLFGSKRWAALVAVMAAVGLLVTACGGGGSQESSSGQQEEAASGSQEQQSSQEQSQASSGESESQEPVTLVWGRGGDSVGLDPINVTDGESFKVINQIYDTLVQYEPGKTSVMPSLALEWSANSDATEWTFRLREGVKFHDGTPFNAEAVKFNFDRWRETSNPYHVGDFGYYAYMFGGFDDDSIIQEVVVEDEYTVKFILRSPQAPFLNNLAMPMFSIASPAAIEADVEALASKPVGTGPFKFVSWQKNDSIVVEANPDYWDGKPSIDRIIYRSIPDNNARLLALQSGDVDVIDGVTPQTLQVAQASGEFDIFYRPAMNVGYLAMNMEKEPFNNPLVRKAINYAINKEAIIQAFYGGLGVPSVTPVPPTMWSHNENVTKYEYDPAKAKQLLAEAGFPNGFETDLWAMPVPRPYMPQPQDIAVAIQNDLAAVGIQTQIVSPEWGTYLEQTGVGEHTMALLGWTGDNGDPDNFLYVLLDKDNAKGPDAGNIAFYKSDELHELLIEAQQNPDQARRTELYEQAQEIIANDAPWVPLAHARVPILARKGLENYVPSPTGSEPLNKVKVNW